MNRYGAWIGAMVAVVALGLGGCSKAPEFGISFKDVSGLGPGSAVTYRGARIGDVKAIEVGDGSVIARVRIEKQYARAVWRESVFTLAKPGGLLDTSGQRVIDVSDPDKGTRTPIRPDEIVEGRSSLSADPMGVAKEVAGVAKRGVEEGARLAAEGWQRWQAFAETPEGREFIDTMKKLAADLARRGAEGLVAFRANELPVLKKKAERLRERLVELGRTKEAEQFWKEFMDWSDTVDAK